MNDPATVTRRHLKLMGIYAIFLYACAFLLLLFLLFLLISWTHNALTSHFILLCHIFTVSHLLNHFHPSHTRPLTGERQEPASDHPHGPGGGRRLHCFLDSHTCFCHHHNSDQHPQLYAADHHLALLHCPGVHQQVRTRPLAKTNMVSPSKLQ